jgi:hypothetical protein
VSAGRLLWWLGSVAAMTCGSSSSSRNMSASEMLAEKLYQWQQKKSVQQNQLLE